LLLLVRLAVLLLHALLLLPLLVWFVTLLLLLLPRCRLIAIIGLCSCAVVIVGILLCGVEGNGCGEQLSGRRIAACTNLVLQQVRQSRGCARHTGAVAPANGTPSLHSHLVLCGRHWT